MSTPFPVKLTADDGIGTFSGKAEFPDPAAQPGQPPFKPTTGNDIQILDTSTDSVLIDGGDDSAGVRLHSADGAVILSVDNSALHLNAANGHEILMNGSGTMVSGNVGFYGTTPIAQPAAPTDTASIIAALKALGLVAP